MRCRHDLTDLSFCGEQKSRGTSSGPGKVQEDPGLWLLAPGEAGHHLLQDDILAEARSGGEALSALGAIEHLPCGGLVVPETLEAVMQKLWPQAVVTGFRNTTRQMGQRTWSSNVQRPPLLLVRHWPWVGLEGWAGGCRAGAWSWTGPGKTEPSYAQAKAGTEGPLRGTPVLLLEAGVSAHGVQELCHWSTHMGGIYRGLCCLCPSPHFCTKPRTREWIPASSHMTRGRNHFLGPSEER